MLTSPTLRPRDLGFTLIELMIVVAVIGILAAIAVPNLMASRKSANENTAIAALKNLATAQSQIATRIAIDVDRNGAGEFAYLGELSGAVGLRDASGTPGPEILKPAILSAGYRQITGGGIAGGGIVDRSGYFFQIFLPDAAGNPVPESPTGGVGATKPDPARATNYWCAYAWPIRSASGQRCFFVNQRGDILSSRNTTTNYYGSSNPPSAAAAFDSMSAGLMTSTVASNSIGLDGQNWIVVQ